MRSLLNVEIHQVDDAFDACGCQEHSMYSKFSYGTILSVRINTNPTKRGYEY